MKRSRFLTGASALLLSIAANLALTSPAIAPRLANPPPTTVPPPPDPSSGRPQAAFPRPTVSATPSPPVPSKFGVHLLLDDGRGLWPTDIWPEHLYYARELVGEGGYVVEVVQLGQLDVARWQLFLDLCERQRLIPILRLATTYDRGEHLWPAPPTDSDGTSYLDVARRYRDFLAQLRWPWPTKYAIVGNEPNRGDEWGNLPNPAAYADYLIAMSAALRSVGVTVLGPALDLYCPNSNGARIDGYRFLDAETFLDTMAAAHPAVFDAIDVWASHAYPLGPFSADPAHQVFQIDALPGANNPHHQTPPSGLFNRGVNSYSWELWKAGQYSPRVANLPVLITETGWRHRFSQDDNAGDSAQATVDDSLLAAYVDLAFRGNDGRYPNLPADGWTPWNSDPRVLAAVLFALDGPPRSWGHTNWLTLDYSGAVTGVLPFFTKVSGWMNPKG